MFLWGAILLYEAMLDAKYKTGGCLWSATLYEAGQTEPEPDALEYDMRVW